MGAHAEETDLTAGGNGNSLAVAQAWSRFLFDAWTCLQVVDPM